MTTEHPSSTNEADTLRAELAEARAELAQTHRALADLERAFAQAPALIAILRGPDHVFDFTNPAYLAVVAPGRDIIGKPVREALPELNGHGIFDVLDTVYRTGTPYVGRELKLELDRYGTGETTPVYFDFVYQPMRDPEGRVSGIMAHAVEVTAQVEARRALANENERVEAEVARRTRELEAQKAFAESIIQHVPAGVAWLDEHWVYRVVNKEYAEGFMKAPREMFLDRYLFDALPGTEPQIEHLVRGVFETGQPHRETEFPFTYKHEGRDVTSYWDFVYYPSFEEGTGRVNGFFILANEVSARVEQDRERARLQADRIEALEQTDRLKDEFLSILSHELRTPINAIMGFGSVLDDEIMGPLNPDQKRFTEKIMDAADALLTLIDDLLVVSRVQAGKFSVSPEPSPFLDLVRRTLDGLQPEAAAKAIRLVNAVPEDLPLVLADVQRVRQVLLNLIGNALKFTPKGGTVTVDARVEGERVRVTVTDTGVGIAREDQPKLFKRFGQLDTSKTRAHQGTGLGLSIVKAIVEAHSGQVGVESAPGQGSTFWFTLPVASEF